MDYYRDPDSIEVAAAARRCLALLAEQAAREPMSSTSPPKTADSIPYAHLEPGNDSQSRPGTGASRRTCGLHGCGQETIMQVRSTDDCCFNSGSASARCIQSLVFMRLPVQWGVRALPCMIHIYGRQEWGGVRHSPCADEDVPRYGVEGSTGDITQVSRSSSAAVNF